MHDLIIEAIAAGGYLGIFALMVLENVFPPVPSEVIMGFGGVLVARGQMEFWPLLAAGTIGSTLGNYAWFWLGQHWGYRRLRPFVARHGRWLTLDLDDVERVSRFFRRHGPWVVFVVRFTPFFRTMISLPAGLAHMGAKRFLAFTFAGTAVWNVLLIWGGTFLAAYLDRYETIASWTVIGLVALALAAYAYRVATWKPREAAE